MLKHLCFEERWNVYSHSLGAIFSLIGIIYIFQLYPPKSFSASIGLIVYGSSILFLFLASTIYHSAKNEKKAFWQKIDHIGIYFLIAGTYTPVTLTILKDSSGNIILFSVWTIAFIGIIYKLLYINKFQNFSLILYLSMGWLILIDFKNIIVLFSKDEFFFLTFGGFFYTFGTIFYRWQKLYLNHLIWHLFVILGAGSHLVMIAKIYSD
ncbi:MAG: hemolysin III family protein [Flavobacteriaceae bacterium]|nr:hemolysin III family protein [Flavobacteriaceae bacterium]